MPRTAQPAKAALDNATRPLTKATKPKPKATHKLSFSAHDFGSALHRWYRENARDLPWRGIDDPYATWLSEIMLQQTRVATVIERYKEFLRRFPTLQALADAREDDVLALWSGLGYYRRARMLHRGAQFVVRELEGKLPSKAVQLRTLPGVGFYTAAAIASISFGESVAVLDGNVERVLLRLLGQPEDRSTQVRTQLLDVAQQLVPAARSELDAADNQNPPGEHNQAMMELGATICLPRSPLCLHCPVFDFCKTRGSHVTEPRARLQSRNVAHLLATRKDKASTEVLLERRAATASLMPDMLELPPLPLDAVAGREPVFRLRHAITNTNYNVEIFTESIAAKKSSPESLLAQVPASASDLQWTPASRLASLPLTGLARKVLQRFELLPIRKIKIGR
jgi:A/G-specific adenine glycosylase